MDVLCKMAKNTALLWVQLMLVQKDSVQNSYLLFSI